MFFKVSFSKAACFGFKILSVLVSFNELFAQHLVCPLSSLEPSFALASCFPLSAFAPVFGLAFS